LEVHQSEEVVVLLTVVEVQLLEVQEEAVVPLNLDQVLVQQTKVMPVVVSHKVVFILPVVGVVLNLLELLVQEVMVEMVVPERQVV
jgi:hypothetical protein